VIRILGSARAREVMISGNVTADDDGEDECGTKERREVDVDIYFYRK
jgi:hypothetical protein